VKIDTILKKINAATSKNIRLIYHGHVHLAESRHIELSIIRIKNGVSHRKGNKKQIDGIGDKYGPAGKIEGILE
jgi:hypothetical protein